MDIVSVTIFLLFGVTGFSAIWKKYYHTALYVLAALIYLGYSYYFANYYGGKSIFEAPEGNTRVFFGFEALIYLLVIGAIGFVLDFTFRKLKRQFENKFTDHIFRFFFYLIALLVNAVILWQILLAFMIQF